MSNPTRRMLAIVGWLYSMIAVGGLALLLPSVAHPNLGFYYAVVWIGILLNWAAFSLLAFYEPSRSPEAPHG